MKNIKITFLGTNGWYDTHTGNTICILVETNNEYVVLDAGNGIHKLDKYIKTKKPIYLFLSHFHLDHVIGLHILAKFRFKQKFYFCVQKKDKKKLFTLLSRQFTMPFSELPFDASVLEISNKQNSIPFLDKALLLKHPVPCMGFRFKFEDKTLAYVPDTGLCANAFKLAERADLLLAECAFKAGQNSDRWPHLNPETAAQIAKKSGAKQLVLVHFDAEIYQTLKDRKEAQYHARKIFRNTVVSFDDKALKI